MAKSTPTKAKAKAKKPSTSASASSSARPKVTVRTVSARRSGPDYRALFSRRFTRDLKLGALFAELVGTFALTAAVLILQPAPLVIALAVLILTAVFWRLSGGHLNPAITVALWASRRITGLRAVGYIVAQLLGAMLAVFVVSQFIASAPAPQVDSLSGMQAQQPHVFTIDKLVGEWRPFLGEALGAVVLGLGVAATRLGRREDLEKGWLIGGAVFLGLYIASLGSSAPLLNPALGLGVSAFDFNNWWTVWVYALAPAFGASVGVWLYKGMQWELKVKDEE